MADTKKDTVTIRVREQRVETPTNGNDARKAVNVLNTSSPEAPAANPFVLSQTKKQGAKVPVAGPRKDAKTSEQ